MGPSWFPKKHDKTERLWSGLYLRKVVVSWTWTETFIVICRLATESSEPQQFGSNSFLADKKSFCLLSCQPSKSLVLVLRLRPWLVSWFVVVFDYNWRPGQIPDTNSCLMLLKLLLSLQCFSYSCPHWMSMWKQCSTNIEWRSRRRRMNSWSSIHFCLQFPQRSLYRNLEPTTVTLPCKGTGMDLCGREPCQPGVVLLF